MNEEQYFEQFSGESEPSVIHHAGDTFVDGVMVTRMRSFEHSSLTCPICNGDFAKWWGRVDTSTLVVDADFLLKPPFVDDQGNPPPNFMYGDMTPVWKHGKWWTDSWALSQFEKANGE